MKKIWLIASYCIYALWKLVESNLQVAREVLSSKPRMTPGIISVPLDAKSDPEILILANTITLTPGSITVGVSQDKKEIFVHSMFIGDVEAFKKDIKEGFEKRIMEIFR